MPTLKFAAQTARRCPSCGHSRALRLFRRWAPTPVGDKRLLHEVCNYCDTTSPNPADMTRAQRERAVESGRVHPAQAALLAHTEAQHRRLAASRRQVKVNKSKRLLAWAPVLRLLRKERAWATLHARDAPTLVWEDFFHAYAIVIGSAYGLAHARATARYGALTPTPDELRPGHWLDAASVRSLRRLFAVCAPVRGRRMYRDPAVFEWCDSAGEPARAPSPAGNGHQ